MFVLIVVILIILLSLCLGEEKYKKYGVLISFLLIFSIFAFRNTAGVDDENYIYYYKLIAQGEIRKFFAISAVEDSFYYLAKPLTMAGFNYKMLFAVYSFISCLFLYLITRKCNFNKKEYLLFFLSFLAFGVLPYITIMRQFPAAMIGIYASLLFNENKYVRAIILLLLAIFLHNSSFIFIFVFLLSKIGFFKHKWLYVILPLLGLVLNATGIFYKLMEIILKGTPYYRHFLDIENDTFGGTSIVVIFMFLIYLASIYIITRKKFQNKNIRILIILEMIFFSLYFVTQNMGVLGRMYDYFIIFQPFSLILIYGCSKEKFRTMFLCGISSLLIFLIIYNFGINNFERFHVKEYSVDVIGEDYK